MESLVHRLRYGSRLVLRAIIGAYYIPLRLCNLLCEIINPLQIFDNLRFKAIGRAAIRFIRTETMHEMHVQFVDDPVDFLLCV